VPRGQGGREGGRRLRECGSTERRGRFTIIDHTADIGIAVVAPDLAGLFEAAAFGLLALLGYRPGVQRDASDSQGIAETQPGQGFAGMFRVELSASDHEALLVDWLNELLYLHDVEGRAPAHVKVESASGGRLSAVLSGRLERAPDLVPREVKAATFHGLHIAEGADGFSATVIFDI